MADPISMEEIGEQWVEFMTTFNGRQSAPHWHSVFYASLEKYAQEQYNQGARDAEYDFNQAQED